MVTATYMYTEKTSEGRIKDRLTYLMDNSRRIIRETMKEREKALETVRKELEKQTLSRLSQDEFVCLVDDGYEDLEAKKHAEAVEGHWVYGRQKRHYEIFNYGDRVVFSITKKIPKEASDAQKGKIMEEAGREVAKKQAKGASDTQVTLYKTSIWLKASYVLDGNIKGKDFSKFHKEFVHNYAKDMDKKLGNIIKDEM